MRGRTRLVLLFCLLACGCAKKSTDQLIADLKGGQPQERVAAIRLLPERKGDAAQVVPVLIEALKDKDTNIRLSAAIGLGSFGDEARDAIPALEAMQRDHDIRLREAAGVALSRIDPAKFPLSSKPRGR